LERPLDKHIDNAELKAVVPWSTESGQEPHGLSSGAVREAELHVQSCVDCSSKVSKYRKLVGQLSNVVVSKVALPGADCPRDQDVDWLDVAAGRWPELKARQLIMHAALCDHCGPLLRAATLVDDDPSAEEERLLAELKPPSRPELTLQRVPPPQPRSGFMRWLVPAMAAILSGGVLATIWVTLSAPLSGAQYAAFAVATGRQYAQGNLALDFRTDSQQTLNEWFKATLPFSLALPASPAAPGEERPYRLEGARLVRVGRKGAVFIGYQLPTGLASLMVTPDSVAVASGGVQVSYKKVTFHYSMVEGYKVVTWSLHGLTYALVSQEGNNTQRSCMVCHSAMRDRDLSQTPTPLGAQPALQ
jgi:anti-sigma factor RsiW